VPARFAADICGVGSTSCGVAAAQLAEVLSVTVKRFLSDESGQTMAEYGVVLTVITIACLGALALLAGNVISAIARVAGLIP
jgi:Flp pilus assembly pilin Flp